MQPPVTTPAGNRLLYRFLLVAAAMYLVWFFGYERWLGPDGRLDVALCQNIADSATAVLHVLGFPATIDAHIPALVLMAGTQSVIVGAPCNGLVLYALFAGFVLAFPGPWRHKAWFIPAGVLLIWLLNVLRVSALAINHHYSHQTVDFNHHYTFTFVVYSCIFGLWMLWARRMATPGGVALFTR
ncbi:exosortase/archaeosortase family protein [Hymenobacter sp. DH14]|uniref:Exosortase/archaeosortase family protein n=1 Tax=Hymenobacter cyanobacteriorum TaxID=2926463 RepID=A0A9X1VKP6_9BACT|nr:archaeosortase/exosortase family protein [Hymenobacter cyanobacteriorum]MCI1190008.1 exosortase/archaeosortase family protein [Hymenobacter cyanobacteriorum]